MTGYTLMRTEEPPMIHVCAASWRERSDRRPSTARWEISHGKILCGAKTTSAWMPIPNSGPPMHEYTYSGMSGWYFYRKDPFCFECLWAFFMPETEGEG